MTLSRPFLLFALWLLHAGLAATPGWAALARPPADAGGPVRLIQAAPPGGPVESDSDDDDDDEEGDDEDDGPNAA